MQQDVLTDTQKEKIARLVEDGDLVDALEKIFLDVVYRQGVIKKGQKLDDGATSETNAALVLASAACSGKSVISDELLGQDLRGMWRGVQLVRQGFKELINYKVGKAPEGSGKNPGR
jgi:hypothetical protein